MRVLKLANTLCGLILFSFAFPSQADLSNQVSISIHPAFDSQFLFKEKKLSKEAKEALIESIIKTNGGRLRLHTGLKVPLFKYIQELENKKNTSDFEKGLLIVINNCKRYLKKRLYLNPKYKNYVSDNAEVKRMCPVVFMELSGSANTPKKGGYSALSKKERIKLKKSIKSTFHFDEAFEYLKLLATEGDKEAAYQMAIIYWGGQALGLVFPSRNNNKKIHWLNIAAKRGHEQAKESLLDIFKYKYTFDENYNYKKRYEVSFSGCEKGALSREITISRGIVISKEEMANVGISGKIGVEYLATLNTEILKSLSKSEGKELTVSETFVAKITTSCDMKSTKRCYIQDKIRSGSIDIEGTMDRKYSKEFSIPIASNLVCL